MSGTVPEQAVQLLADALPDEPAWVVVMAGTEGDAFERPTAIIERDAFAPMPTAPRSHYTHELDVWVPAAPDALPNTLHQRVEVATGAIEDVPGWAWTRAELGTYRGTPAYRITTTLTTRKEPLP